MVPGTQPHLKSDYCYNSYITLLVVRFHQPPSTAMSMVNNVPFIPEMAGTTDILALTRLLEISIQDEPMPVAQCTPQAIQQHDDHIYLPFSLALKINLETRQIGYLCVLFHGLV